MLVWVGAWLNPNHEHPEFINALSRITDQHTTRRVSETALCRLTHTTQCRDTVPTPHRCNRPAASITSCAGGRHNMPRPLQVDLWPFDLESGVLVTCDVGYLCANFILPRPLCSRLRPYVRDRQTSDAHHRLMPPPKGRGHYNHTTKQTHTHTERERQMQHAAT